MRNRLVAALAILIAAPALAAQTAPAPPPAVVAADPALTGRAKEIVALLNGQGDYAATFSAAFRAAVPKDKFDAIAAQLKAQAGLATGIHSIDPVAPWQATVIVDYQHALVTMQLVVDRAGTHQVTGLRITGMSASNATLGSVRDAISQLPGSTGFEFAKLGEGAPQRLESHNPDQPFAVGSAFKLVILSELVRETNAGTRRWDDKVTLDGRPLPGGAFAASPAGTQVSIRDLAAKMISVSDNSAADILLHLVGRDRAEAMLPVLGVSDPRRDRPYLSTLEMFKLKGVDHGALGMRYLALDEAGRRSMLDREVDPLPISAIDPALFADKKPVLIDRIEWYFTPADLVRIMDWLRRNTDSGAGAEARTILAINSGIGGAAKGWKYVGYKGGSEPGVLDMTLLLQAKDDSWYVLTGSWNNPAADVDLMQFAGLVSRAAELGAPGGS